MRITTDEKLSQIKNVANRKLVKKYIAEQKALGRTEGRIKKILWQLVIISNRLGKDFKKANKNDIINLVNHIEDNGYKQWTVIDYKVLIKRFYKWSEGKDEFYPSKVAWLKDIKRGLKDTVKNSDLITKDEVIQMIESTTSQRNKAMVSLLYETGIRVGELLNIRLKDIDKKSNPHMILIEVTGKTGTRTVFLRGFKKHLIDYLNSHPDVNKNEDSPLWYALNDKQDKPITYARVRNILRTMARRANIKKNVRPHLFRHGYATYISGKMTEAEMKDLMGWTNKSQMPAVYTHRNPNDIKNAVAKKLHGLKDTEISEMDDTFKPLLCDNCGRENPADAKYCNCGTVLDIKTAMQLETDLKDARIVEQRFSNDLLKMYSQLKQFEKQLKAMNKN